jgi:putative nucleotidyltransferase with HDIG domain
LLTLARSLEARDPYTKGHSQRVGNYARQLALRLGWGARDAARIELAGLLHDIGKVAIPVDVLAKPERLTPAEQEIIERHPALGAELCQAFPSLEPVIPAIRSHHERWDGKGYPDRLAGTGIPLWGRLLAVVDTFDALTSDRPYRPRLADDQALAILQEGAGTQWDANLVTAFVAMIETSRRDEHPARWTGILVRATGILRGTDDLVTESSRH